MEIGTHQGRGAAAIIKCLNKLGCHSRFLTFDIDYENFPLIQRRRFYPRTMWAENGEPVANIGPCKGEFHEMRGDEGTTVLNPERDFVAWVWVDGCHCFDCVKKEIDAWAPLIVPGGFLLFHDCSPVYDPTKPDQEYHGKEAVPFGVIEAIEKSPIVAEEFELWVKTSPEDRRKGWFGGTYGYRKK